MEGGGRICWPANRKASEKSGRMVEVAADARTEAEGVGGRMSAASETKADGEKMFAEAEAEAVGGSGSASSDRFRRNWDSISKRFSSDFPVDFPRAD